MLILTLIASSVFAICSLQCEQSKSDSMALIAQCRQNLQEEQPCQNAAHQTEPVFEDAEEIDFDRLLQECATEDFDPVFEGEFDAPKAKGFIKRMKMYCKQAGIIGALIASECWMQAVADVHGEVQELSLAQKMQVLPKFSYGLAKMAIAVSSTSMATAWARLKETSFGDADKELTVKERTMLYGYIMKTAILESAKGAKQFACSSVNGVCELVKNTSKKSAHLVSCCLCSSTQKVFELLGCSRIKNV